MLGLVLLSGSPPSQPPARPPPTRLRFNPTPTFLGVTFDRTLSFFKQISSLIAKFCPRLKALCCISAFSALMSPSLFCINLFFGSISLTLHPDGLHSKHYQFHQIGTPSPSGQSRHHRLPPVLPYFTSSLRGFFTSSTSHPDSFHSAIL